MNRLVTGIKPTGDIHLGSYFGVMRDLVASQDAFECYIFVADLHAVNQVQNREEMEKGIMHITRAYLAVGLDPEKVTLFQQSQVPAQSELSVILGALTGMGLLERAHAYKDALAKQKTTNVGLFTYPVLMAADILAYNPQVVPVGPDQLQHLEIAREIAGRFNHIYGETFQEPQALHQENVSIVGTDGQKMSKSYSNVIGLFDTPEVTVQKVSRITTDSKSPEEVKDPEADTLFAYHRLVSGDQLADIERRYREGGMSYRESKEILSENMNRFLQPMRDRYHAISDEDVREVLRKGSAKANEIANQTLQQVLEKTGLRP